MTPAVNALKRVKNCGLTATDLAATVVLSIHEVSFVIGGRKLGVAALSSTAL